MWQNFRGLLSKVDDDGVIVEVHSVQTPRLWGGDVILTWVVTKVHVIPG